MSTVDHPRHYNAHPSGVECIDVVEHLPFNLGNAVKYLWRAGQKGPADEDRKKAAWYLRREIARLKRGGGGWHQLRLARVGPDRNHDSASSHLARARDAEQDGSPLQILLSMIELGLEANPGALLGAVEAIEALP